VTVTGFREFRFLGRPQCFTSSHIGYMGDGFYRSKTQPTVSKYWRRKL